jgi:putative PIN family toxin of toxin-antitoxin system
VKAAEANKVTIYASEQIVGEISQVLTYSKFKSIYESEGLRSQDLIEAVLKIVKFVAVSEKIHVVTEHPADDKFVECAHAAGARYIVSGDKHLLKIVCYKKTLVVSVNEYLKVLESTKKKKKS